MATRVLEKVLNDAQKEEVLHNVTRLLARFNEQTIRNVRKELETGVDSPRDRFFLEMLRTHSGKNQERKR